jgi:hypothetical protein
MLPNDNQYKSATQRCSIENMSLATKIIPVRPVVPAGKTQTPCFRQGVLHTLFVNKHRLPLVAKSLRLILFSQVFCRLKMC